MQTLRDVVLELVRRGLVLSGDVDLPGHRGGDEGGAALAGEVAITELDVRFNTLPPSAEGLEQQRRDYETIVGACAVVPGCVGVTVWDFTDKVGVRERWVCRRLMPRDTWQYSWIPGTFPESGDACPWDDVSALVSSSTLGC